MNSGTETTRLDAGARLCGFTVERARDSRELGGRLVEMKHDETGAELIFIDNGESNKLFCVGFKTLPEDSTGVFHILEHSVLCGSERYPVKEPFVHLLKSSMYTFLNAITWPDKTVYPISSRNERDFLNLTSVYLDAVFAPLCVVDPNAFRQEGWHLELAEDGSPIFNGVVYNEMKGATSSVDEILSDGLSALLFPDNCYGFNYGGDPKVIPELTYERYCEMYRKYYAPSNARFFLDGSVPLEKTLALIDSYLRGRGRSEGLPPIPMQRPKKAERTLYYELGAEESEANKTMLGMGRLIGDYSEKRKLMMIEVLSSILAGTNDAPLKRAILDAGLAEDVSVYVLNEMQQATFNIVLRNTESEKLPAIRATVKKVLDELLEKGIDRELLAAQINRKAFALKDLREPSGLLRCFAVLGSTLYGGDPMLYLEDDADIEALRAAMGGNDYEKLLESMLELDDMSVLTVLPSKTLGEEQRKSEAERAQKLYSSLSVGERSELAAMNERLFAWQREPDSSEASARLPVLPLSEVGREPMLIPTEELDVGGVRVLFHKLASHGIASVNLYFNIAELSENELPTAGLIALLLTKLPTSSHSVQQLQTLINAHIGRLNFNVNYASCEAEGCTPYLTVSFSALEENVEKALSIVREILLETDFSDRQRIKELLVQIDERFKQVAIMSGSELGTIAVNSHYLSEAAAMNMTGGLGFRAYVKRLNAGFDELIDGEIGSLKVLSERAFAKKRLTIGMTGDAACNVGPLVSALPVGTAAPECARYKTNLPRRLGVRIPAQVGFAVKGCFAGEQRGAMLVAETIMSLEYLWSRVRVQGGAYGSGLRLTPNGTVASFSYRDPTPARSIGVYDKEAEFLRDFASSGASLDKFIISAIGSTEPLRSSAQLGAKEDMELLSGRGAERAKRIRREMLQTKSEDLLALSTAFEECAKSGAVCVFASESALSELTDLTVIDF